MKKLKLAVIGRGRSGRDIHGAYYLSERNEHFEVGYIVDRDPVRREEAKKRHAGAVILSDYRELFGCGDIDLVVNASYSADHFPITKDLLEHGFNVLSEKPFAATRRECDLLIETARAKGLLLAVFQNTQVAPFFTHAKALIDSGRIGEVMQISLRYNGLSRRWDWQTLQKKLGGSSYNTGPHPIMMALGFLDFDPRTRVAYSRLACASSSGDAEDYVKIILDAPGRPPVDIEITSTDAYTDYNLLIQGSRGSFRSRPNGYSVKYYTEEENPPHAVIEDTLRDRDGMPVYCSEDLVLHEESGTYEGTAFDIGTAGIYEGVYRALTEGAPLPVSCEQAAMGIGVIETVHAQNPLPLKFV